MRAPNDFIEALLNHQFEVAEKFVSAGIGVNARYGELEWTALRIAAENTLPDATERLVTIVTLKSAVVG